jgi:hypothetical protein
VSEEALDHWGAIAPKTNKARILIFQGLNYEYLHFPLQIFRDAVSRRTLVAFLFFDYLSLIAFFLNISKIDPIFQKLFLPFK